MGTINDQIGCWIALDKHYITDLSLCQVPKSKTIMSEGLYFDG